MAEWIRHHEICLGFCVAKPLPPWYMYKCLGRTLPQKTLDKTLPPQKRQGRLIDLVPHWPPKSLHNPHFSLPFQVFWHLAYISLYLKKRSRCGETSKQESMEIIDCAETHGLLEARTPCFSIQVVDLALWAPENSSKCLQPQVAQIIEGTWRLGRWPLRSFWPSRGSPTSAEPKRICRVSWWSLAFGIPLLSFIYPLVNEAKLWKPPSFIGN